MKKAVKIKRCEWIFDYVFTNYDTSCGLNIRLERGTPKENGYVFCPFCGKVIDSDEGGKELEKGG